MLVSQKNALNIRPGTAAQLVVHVSQGDTGSNLEFYLYNGSDPYEPDGVAITLEGMRKTGTGVGPIACTYVGNLVTVQTTAEMTAEAGPVLCELIITDGSGESIGTANFAILVEEATFPDGPLYNNSVDVYSQILAYVQTIPANVDASVNARIAVETAAREAADTVMQTNIANLQSGLASETSARTAADALLQTEIDNIIAPSGEAPSAAEVQNARIGADGTVYDTLGNAIRGQVTDLESALNELQETGYSFFDRTGFVSGVLNGSTGEVITASGNRYRAVSPIMSFNRPLVVSLTDSNYRYYLCYYSDQSTVTASPGWKTEEWTIPANQLFRIQIAKVSGEQSTDVADVSLFITKVHYISGIVTMLRNEVDSLPPNQTTADITGQIAQGGAQSDGTVTRLTYRTMTAKRWGGLPYDVKLKVVPNGQGCSWMIYNSLYATTYYSKHDWVTSETEVTLPAGKYIQFSMTKLPATAQTSFAPSENLVHIYCDRYTPTEQRTDGLSEAYDIYNYADVIKKAFIPEMSFDGNTGSYTRNLQRSAVIAPLRFPFDITIECDDDYSFVLEYFSGNIADLEHFVTSTFTWTNRWTVPANQWFGMLARYTNDANVDASVIEALRFSSPIDIVTIAQEIANINTVIGGMDYTNYSVGVDLVRRRLAVTEVGTLSQQQSFCIYNGYYYSTNGSWITKQDSSFNVVTSVQLAVGHGNTFQLGSTNLAYISGWDDQTIYVVNLDSLTLVDTITLPTTGYTSAVVDDVRKLAYIFQRDTYPLTYETYNFIVYDYLNEKIIKESTLTVPFSALQGMDLYDDKIIAVNGLGSNMSSTYPDYKNGYRVYDLNGKILSSWTLGAVEEKEPEGICINRDTGETLLMMGDAKLYKIT